MQGKVIWFASIEKRCGSDREIVSEVRRALDRGEYVKGIPRWVNRELCRIDVQEEYRRMRRVR